MKAFLALTFLASISLVAGVDMENLVPLDRVMPVNPRHTAQEWQEIYAAAEPRPEDNSIYKLGTEPQPEFAGKVHVPLKEQANRITNGYTAVRGQFPWMAGLIINNSGFCGGSLISNRWVLTAAHCTGTFYMLMLGANRRDIVEFGAMRVTATRTIIHPNWNPININNDIAVIELPVKVDYTIYITPIRLRNIAGTLAGVTARVSGWGRTSDTSSALPINLQYADLPIITNQQCAQTFGSIIIHSTLCTATVNGRNVCNGDSGSALAVRDYDGQWTQVGIASFVAAGGCSLPRPAGFARVTSFLGWISSVTGLSFG